MSEPAVVSVSVATLWRSPERVRKVDLPALDTPPDLRTWARMSAAEQRDLLGRTDSQLLLGDPVRVDELRDGWARVIAPGQASSKDPRGYPGWIPAAHLTLTAEVPAETTHVVDALTTDIRAALDGAIVVADVVLGTSLTAVGPSVDGWLPVSLPGHEAPAWAPLTSVASLAAAPNDAVDQAERLLGVRYVWGGLTPYGIDCSGLVNVCLRRIGVTVPRDASDQAAATTPLQPGEERRGDLYFFAREGTRVTHVGFVAAPPDADGTRHMVHACGGKQVVAEPLSDERIETLVGAHRVS